ncbi:MAG: helix-hairpin-helix domain-containing protein [Bacillota bacterium]
MIEGIKGNKQALVIILIISIAVSFWLGVKYAQWRLIEKPLEIVEETPIVQEQEKTPEPQKILVHVAGEVESPGIYELLEGARVEDALQRAVPTQEADVDSYLNRAQVLHDQDKIIVQKKGEPNQITQVSPVGTIGAAVSTVPFNGKININTATIKELETLTGIGTVKAQAIIDYRTTHGRFSSIEDLQKVKGIGEATFTKIIDRITI